MRLAWVSFDVMGRDCLAAAAEAGADVVAAGRFARRTCTTGCCAQTRQGAFTYLGEDKLVVWRARPVDLEEPAAAGTVVGLDGEAAVVARGEGGLVLEEVEGVDGPLPVGAHLG